MKIDNCEYIIECACWILDKGIDIINEYHASVIIEKMIYVTNTWVLKKYAMAILAKYETHNILTNSRLYNMFDNIRKNISTENWNATIGFMLECHVNSENPDTFWVSWLSGEWAVAHACLLFAPRKYIVIAEHIIITLATHVTKYNIYHNDDNVDYQKITEMVMTKHHYSWSVEDLCWKYTL